MNKYTSRINKTISCKDSEYIPKCDNAGKIDSPYQIMHNGLKIVKGCYHGDWMTEIIEKCKGHHEPQEEKAFHEVLKYIKPESCMIEVGSFWAYYSMWFNKNVTNAKNYMIDVEPRYLDIGKENFKINNMVGSFHIGKVPIFSIDSFINKHQINFVHLLHSDIQGEELNLLKGAITCLNKIGYVFISTHSEKLHVQCMEFFKENNFVILCDHSLSQSASVDGLIVAKNPEIDIEFTSIEISK